MKDIPVTGLLYDSDKNSSHSHILYITSWDNKPVLHTHQFKGVTSFNVGHNHRYVGTTEPAPSGVQHTHRYCTITSIDAEHRHTIRGVTGPAIPLPRGGHFHEFCGVTTVDGAIPHRHKYRGRTSI